ncbi:MAG: hypothetical protein JW779_08600 [Candidatus Thorarchaeota archaeon]|nr:hypothetical protein [Candidatus Thorarchaeota archaeon]
MAITSIINWADRHDTSFLLLLEFSSLIWFTFYPVLYYETVICMLRLVIPMDHKTASEILRIASEIESNGFADVARGITESKVLGLLFHGATLRDSSICNLAAARLNMQSVDLSWSDVDFADSNTLLEELKMASDAVDLLVTIFSGHETFGEGRRLTTKFPDYSSVPVISLRDDIYDWQSALSHIRGFQRELGDIQGKQIVINWAFGSTFASPSIAHGLLALSALLGANVRVVAPPEFSLLNRVRRKAKEIASETGSTYAEASQFDDAFKDADAVFSLNWFRLDDFNHPERNPQYASKYKDWYMTQEIIPEHCVFSTEPTMQTDLTLDSSLLGDSRNITRSWLVRRVRVLAAGTLHTLRKNGNVTDSSIV